MREIEEQRELVWLCSPNSRYPKATAPQPISMLWILSVSTDACVYDDLYEYQQILTET